MIKKILLALVIILPVTWISLAIYVMVTDDLEGLMICSTTDYSRIPKSVCEYYTLHFRGTKKDIAQLEKGIGISFVFGDEKMRAKFLSFLLDKGANINLISPLDGMTPLHSAVLDNDPELVKFLLDRGADPTIRKGKGFSSASKVDNMTPLEMLDKMAELRPEMTDRSKVKQILEAKINPAPK